jgi:uncharacterized protein YbcI
VLVCVMGDVFTTVERTLIAAGEHARVRETRLAFEDATRDEFVVVLEPIVGRPVLGVSSQVLVEQDMAVQMFVLGLR